MNISELIDCLLYLFMALSLPYTAIVEAEKARKNGNHKKTYRLTFAAGMICFMFLQISLKYFLTFI